ncbi:YggT family protein [Acinetobacter sp. 187]|uniref:YggT family protein n=1 Tax=Acinetobacter lanii TaxID=2715163 RepID=UPI00140BFC85|nr:YggT family protein [Acinetobacter lanii]NHC03576.1 YggT family protein [Acinetobacter lanii]
MGASAALFFDIIINVAILLVFFRFLMQLAGVSPYNPVVMSTVKATKIVDVFGSILPTVGKGRVNLAALVLAVLLYFLKVFGFKYLNAQPTGSTVYFVVSTLLAMLQSLVTILKYLLFGYIISSWIVMFTQSRSPYIEVLQELAEPMLAPFRKIMPNMGMIDLSPILAFFTLYIAEMMLKSIG